MDSAALKDALMVSRIQKFKFHSITNKSRVFLNVAYLVNWISFIISIKHIFCQVILKCSWSNKYKFPKNLEKLDFGLFFRTQDVTDIC